MADIGVMKESEETEDKKEKQYYICTGNRKTIK